MDTETTYAQRVSPFGADLRPTAWGDVTLDRVGLAPLRFSGSRLCWHWRQFRGGPLLSIALWTTGQAGFVVGYSALSGQRVATDGVAVDSLDEAITFMEDCCAHPQPPDPVAGQVVDRLFQLQQAADFSQAFASLVGDALAVWIDLDHTGDNHGLQHGPQHGLQNRAIS